jgi:hypothetical protein
MFENIYIEKDEKLIVAFINSNGELEYTEYEAKDGGTFELDNTKEFTKEELEDFLIENV